MRSYYHATAWVLVLRASQIFAQQETDCVNPTSDLGVEFYAQGGVVADGITYFRHGGSTSGQAAYVGFNLSNITGAVVLCNFKTPYNIILGDKILKAINKY